jgi:hypothetical protein
VLQQAPPGYSPFAINRQNVTPLAQPGRQGGAVLGQPAPGASSYLPPSSQPLSPPAAPAGGALSAANTAAIVKMLAARGGAH